MTAASTIFESEMPCISVVQRGQVSGIFMVDEKFLFLMATDRILAFDFG